MARNITARQVAGDDVTHQGAQLFALILRIQDPIGDATYLRQVVGNLISHVVKFTQPGKGVVTLTRRWGEITGKRVLDRPIISSRAGRATGVFTRRPVPPGAMSENTAPKRFHPR